MKDIAIRAENVGKKFSRGINQMMINTVKDISRNIVGLEANTEQLRRGEFWAVDDISFEIKKGESVGIIGPNGSGKTTLLKMLNGIYMPDRGKITINGKTGALIAVGAGFHPQLTGRENIYINATILGMNKKEIESKYDSIIDFAEIGDFIDSPIKFYSSGMYIRLGFSVAIHCDPEIMLIDEVLAVGDHSFRKKCLEKLKDKLNSEMTVVFVSHNFDQVKNLCDKAIFLLNGEIIKYGASEEVISDCYVYYSSIKNKTEVEKKNIDSKEAAVISMNVVDEHERSTKEIKHGESIDIMLILSAKGNIRQLNILIGIHTADGVFIANNSHGICANKGSSEIEAGIWQIKCKMDTKTLNPGIYYLRCSLADNDDLGRVLYSGLSLCSFRIMPEGKVNNNVSGYFRPDAEWEAEKVNNDLDL